eukprot:3374560-Pleurochrysis_carterae.AAC.1
MVRCPELIPSGRRVLRSYLRAAATEKRNRTWKRQASPRPRGGDGANRDTLSSLWLEQRMHPPQSGEAGGVNSELQCGPAEDAGAAVAGESHAEEEEARTKERKLDIDSLGEVNNPDGLPGLYDQVPRHYRRVTR